jgi:transketolase
VGRASRLAGGVKKIGMFGEDLLENLGAAAKIGRGLAMDAVAAAGSGHLGLPLGCAEIGAALFGHLLRLNPEDPRWINRDRFILSAGHGSMFLYAWLYLSGFRVGDLRQFRTEGSYLPGHPEFGVTSGVECTTGPLGQGVANAVGFAVSQRMQLGQIPDAGDILDYRVICLCSDGDLQEGISHEACSLAGHWGLNNLILIYDSNGVTLDAPLAETQSEDICGRFEAYGFFVQEVDGHDVAQFIAAYGRAARSFKPSLIIAKTVIGRGLTGVEGTKAAHGEAGIKFIGEGKRKLGLPEGPFFVSDDVNQFFTDRRRQWREDYDRWMVRFDAWKRRNGEAWASFFGDRKHENGAVTEPIFRDYNENFDGRQRRGILPAEDALTGEDFFGKVGKISMREAGGKVLNRVAQQNPKIVTGSADLFSSNKNYLLDNGDFGPKCWSGRNIAFGVREYAMGAILNGIAYDGIFRPSGATFLVFSDYLRPAIRLAAMARLPVVYIFTHDSVAIGCDGPTHQPVEILAALRSVPNLDVIRPADAEECIGAYGAAFSRENGPTALVLSRQDLPALPEGVDQRHKVFFGAYIVSDASENVRLIVLATGSEVALVLKAARDFSAAVRVVSMPSMEIFERQNAEYKEKILPLTCPLRLAVEAGSAMPWYRYVGPQGRIVAVDDFGFSASGERVLEHFGLSVDCIRVEIQSLLMV